MSAIASQITSLVIVYSTVYSDADLRKHQSSASLAFVRRIHRGPVNSPHKWPVTRKMFPPDDVIMNKRVSSSHFIMGIAIHIIQRPYIESDPRFWGESKVRPNFYQHIDGLVEGRRSSIVHALELRHSWTKPSVCAHQTVLLFMSHCVASSRESILLCCITPTATL